MKQYIGNCSDVIDWNSILQSLATQEPGYVGPRHKKGDVKAIGIDDVATVWSNAGYVPIYNGGNAGWDMFLPGQNFSYDVVDKFAKFVGLDGCTNAWISRVNPGYVAPWHWDVTDDEATLDKKADIQRYHCHIQLPESTIGHTLILEDEFFYKEKQGAVYKWPSRKSWHGASNCGLTPLYLFNFWY
jgi:hypothetical protein